MSIELSEAYPELHAAIETWRYQPQPQVLHGRTILVTGAGDGIGACTARTFALYGANVILLGKTRTKLEGVFDWIESHTDTQPVIVPVDLEQLTPESAEALRDSIEQTYGALHGIVHNASLLGPKVPIAHYPYAEWVRVMQVNANAPFLLTQALFGLLDAAPDACVINTSSSVGRQGRAYWGAYAVSKFAVEGFSQVLADETESAGHIRVYSINPGGTRTPMRRAAYPVEDPADVPPPEAHMDLYLFLMAPPSDDKKLPPTGAQLDARSWDRQ